MRKLAWSVLVLCLASAERAAASACYVGVAFPPNRVSAGGFQFEYPVRFIGTGAGTGDVPGGAQDAIVSVVYAPADTSQQRRDKLYTAIQAAATGLGIPAPNRANCAGFYEMPMGTL